MTLAGPARWRLGLILIAVLAVLVSALNPLPASAAPGTDDEGGTASLRKALDEAASGYNNAKARRQVSQQRQKTLVAQIASTEKRLTVLEGEAQRLGAAAYRGGLPDPLTVMANSRSASELLDRATIVDTLSRQTSRTLRDLRNTRKTLADQRKSVEKELRYQQTQEALMLKRRQQAEQALSERGGGNSAGLLAGTSAAATPAPRNSDGSWPPESCSIDDPTTNGCITPRMLHAYQQARANDFTRFTACQRAASFGEHPKGRACDFSVTVGGFGGVASGDAKQYGDRLAAFFVDNADRLAVLYVIWFQQIWLPGVGWKAYTEGNGDPSSEHQNHVHLSVQ